VKFRVTDQTGLRWNLAGHYVAGPKQRNLPVRRAIYLRWGHSLLSRPTNSHNRQAFADRQFRQKQKNHNSPNDRTFRYRNICRFNRARPCRSRQAKDKVERLWQANQGGASVCHGQVSLNSGNGKMGFMPFAERDFAGLDG
jgi:hypothetical protein